MKTKTLFELPATNESKRVKLTALKRKHGILTYRSKHMSREEEPWIAVIPFQADQGRSIGSIMAECGGLYEETGYCATGTGELSAVRELCKLRGIACDI